MTETAQQNRYQRALEASFREVGRKQQTAGHDFWFRTNHRLLTEHAPAAGPDPVCTAPDCGEPWPCGTAETAMDQVGVRS
jgi:hypothetical protein